MKIFLIKIYITQWLILFSFKIHQLSLFSCACYMFTKQYYAYTVNKNPLEKRITVVFLPIKVLTNLNNSKGWACTKLTNKNNLVCVLFFYLICAKKFKVCRNSKVVFTLCCLIWTFIYYNFLLLVHEYKYIYFFCFVFAQKIQNSQNLYMGLVIYSLLFDLWWSSFDIYYFIDCIM